MYKYRLHKHVQNLVYIRMSS